MNPGRPKAGIAAWALLAPVLLWLGAFVVAPTAILLVYAFLQHDELGRVVAVFTFENFRRVLDPVYLGIFRRSIVYSGVTTGLCLVLGYPVGYFIARRKEAARARLLLLLMVPFWRSFLIRTYAWMTILKQQGLLNGLLQYLDLIRSPVEMLYTPGAVIIGLVYAYLPFMILPIYASAEKLDPALIEAAHDLGAGPLRVFSSVVFPLTRAGVAAGILLVFVPSIGMFAVTDLMGGARVPLIGDVIQNQFFQARDWPFGSALGIAFLLLFALAYGLLLRRQDRQP
jgi:spermidine/putrescine transport system permease protein